MRIYSIYVRGSMDAISGPISLRRYERSAGSYLTLAVQDLVLNAEMYDTELPLIVSIG